MKVPCMWCDREFEGTDKYPGAIILYFCSENCKLRWEAAQEPRPTPEELEREYYRKRHARRTKME